MQNLLIAFFTPSLLAASSCLGTRKLPALNRDIIGACFSKLIINILDYSSHTNQRHRLWFIFRSHAAVQQLWVYRNWSMMTQRLWKLDHGSAHSGVLERARISNSGSYSSHTNQRHCLWAYPNLWNVKWNGMKWNEME